MGTLIAILFGMGILALIVVIGSLISFENEVTRSTHYSALKEHRRKRDDTYYYL
jgi:hypothetical protein